MEAFPRRRLVQTLADPDVDGVTPVHWGLMLWRNPETRRNRSILALGFNPDDPFFVDPSLAEKTDALKQKGRILFDQLSRPEFGPIADWYRDGRVVETEIAGNRVRVAGLVSLGTSFGADGNLLTSTETFLDLMPQKPPGAIEVGLVRLKPGADPEQVVSRLRQRLPKDVSVLTKQGFIDFEQNYWKSSTSIGFIFTLGAAMGFVVGCVIVYQVLYTDVSDHLPEYATLMAMGYRLSHLLGVVVREGFYLAAMGYVPAYLAGQGLYWFVRDATKLPVGMDLSRALTVLVMILVMCMLSSFLAMRRLIDADPAEIF
jgi:putative ABC transport system permease protein